jgi:hypothetical protein
LVSCSQKRTDASIVKIDSQVTTLRHNQPKSGTFPAGRIPSLEVNLPLPEIRYDDRQ